MKTETLVTLVKREAKKLIKYATPEERSKLSFGALFPSNIHLCIYGQMTGYCFSNRATDLLNKCIKPYSTDLVDDANSSHSIFLEGTSRDFSPIEVFISLGTNKVNGNNRKLIEFLKGESDTLDLF